MIQNFIKARILKIKGSKYFYPFLKGILYFVVIAFLAYYFEHGVFVDQYSVYRMFFILSAGVIFPILVRFRTFFAIKTEYGFLLISLVLGSLLVFSAPRTANTWDDDVHYQISESLASTIIPSPTRPYKVKASFSFIEQKKIDQDLDRTYASSVDGAATKISILQMYRQIGHIPGATGILIGRALNIAPHTVYSIGRWMNLIVYILVVFFAIRRLKSGKLLLATISLLPTWIFIAANYGYDSWVTSFTILGVSYIFSILQTPEKKFTYKDMFIVLGSFLFGFGPKAIYFLLFLLIFLIPRSAYRNQIEYRRFLVVSMSLMLLVVSSFVLPLLFEGVGVGDSRGGPHVDPGGQIDYIVSSPIEYAGVVLGYFKEYFTNGYAQGSVTSFAYLGETRGYFLILSLILSVVLLGRSDSDSHIASRVNRMLIYIVSSVTILLIVSVLYIAFNSVGSQTIAGLQARYAIPLFFPVLYTLGSLKIVNGFKASSFTLVIFIILSMILSCGIWELIIGNYF